MSEASSSPVPKSRGLLVRSENEGDETPGTSAIVFVFGVMLYQQSFFLYCLDHVKNCTTQPEGDCPETPEVQHISAQASDNRGVHRVTHPGVQAGGNECPTPPGGCKYAKIPSQGPEGQEAKKKPAKPKDCTHDPLQFRDVRGIEGLLQWSDDQRQHGEGDVSDRYSLEIFTPPVRVPMGPGEAERACSFWPRSNKSR